MLTLGLIVRNEAAMLGLTLPVTAPSFFNRLALDTGSTDGTVALLKHHDFHVTRFTWTDDYSAARNTLLDVDMPGWLLQLDADEAMFPCDVIALTKLCATVTEDAIALPRVNLADSGRLQCTDNAPDWQARCIRMGSTIRWELPVHEVIKAPQHRAANIPIYHYGFCKPPRDCWLRSHNYTRIAAGQPTLTEAPGWVCNDADLWLADMSKRHNFARFTGVHPLRGLL